MYKSNRFYSEGITTKMSLFCEAVSKHRKTQHPKHYNTKNWLYAESNPILTNKR